MLLSWSGLVQIIICIVSKITGGVAVIVDCNIHFVIWQQYRAMPCPQKKTTQRDLKFVAPSFCVLIKSHIFKNFVVCFQGVRGKCP